METELPNTRSSRIVSRSFAPRRRILALAKLFATWLEDWDESTFYPDPPDVDKRKTYSTPYQTEICKESKKQTKKRQVPKKDLMTGADFKDKAGNVVMVEEDYEVIVETPILGTKWIVTDENLQKIIMGKYEREMREKEKKSQEKISCSLVLKLKVFRLLFFRVFTGHTTRCITHALLLYQVLFSTRHIK